MIRNDNLPKSGETLKERLYRRKQAEQILEEKKSNDKFRKDSTESIKNLESKIDRLTALLNKQNPHTVDTKSITSDAPKQENRTPDTKDKLDKRKQAEETVKEHKANDKFRKDTADDIKKLDKQIGKLIGNLQKKASQDKKKINKLSEELDLIAKHKETYKKKINLGNVLAGDVGMSDLIKKKLKGTIYKSIGASKYKSINEKIDRVTNAKKALSEKGIIGGIANMMRDKKLNAKYSNEKALRNDLLKAKVEEHKTSTAIKTIEKHQDSMKDDTKEIIINQNKLSDAINKIGKKVDLLNKKRKPEKPKPVVEQPKQDTTITRTTETQKDHKWNGTLQKDKVHKFGNQNNNNGNGGPDIDIDFDGDRNSKKQRRINRLKRAKLGSKLKGFATGGLMGGMVGAVSTGLAAEYIGGSLMDNYDQYQNSDTEAERNDAVAKSTGGVSGAIAGGIIGAKALGTSGFIGGTVVPGLGNIAGLTGGAITGAAAGGALGYYMGDKVGDYIENMWTGPLEKIPDSKRNNPFTIHDYLTNSLIPELNKSLAMEQDSTKRKDIIKGIEDYTDLANKALQPDALKKWMQTKLDDNKLATADVGSKVAYLNDLMSQFKYNENYYNAGEAVIDEVAKNTGVIDTYTSKISEFVYGKKSKESDDKKNLEKAEELSKFNSNNKLGKKGSSLELSLDTSKNFDALVKAGIVSDDWGSNSIKDVSKLKELPLSVLEGLKKDGSLDDDATKEVDKVINDKKNTVKPKTEENKIEKNIPAITPITTVTAANEIKNDKPSKTPDNKTTLSGITGVNGTSNGVINDTKTNKEDSQKEDVEKLAEESYNAEQDLIKFLNENPYDDMNSTLTQTNVDGIPQEVRLFKDGALNKKLADLREKVLDSRRNYNDAKMVILANSKDKGFLAQHGIYTNKNDASAGASGNFGPKISDDEFYYKEMAKDLERANISKGVTNRSLSGTGSGSASSGGSTSAKSFENNSLGLSTAEDKSVPSSYEGLGGMSAQFESGGRGSAAVGWDSTGGTSYGKFQIATKTGTMKRFMDFLKGNNPAAYQALANAGPADSGKDGNFAQVWRKIAKDGTLGNSEFDFIKSTHYDVGVKGIKSNTLRTKLGSSKALQEVMWSTSVQHGGGGASTIFNKVYQEGMSDQDLIKAIYAERSTKFGSSTAEVRASVQNRFVREQKLALGIKNDGDTGTVASTGSSTSGTGTSTTSTSSGTSTKEPTLTNNSVTPKAPMGEDAMVNKTGTKDAQISVDNNTKTMVDQSKQQASNGSNTGNVTVINSSGGSSGGNTVSNNSFTQKQPDPTLMYAALNK